MASLAALLKQHAHDLSRHVAAAIRGEMRGVHQGRVASRRLRESLPVAGGRAAAAREARRSFRMITRALGPVRELDVALDHLEQGLEGAKIPRMAIERVRAHVREERERRRERMLARLERVDLAGALDRIDRIARGPARRLTAANAVALERRVRARALTVEMAIERAGTLYDPERLHAVRIAGKKLRYALEVVRAASLARVQADLRLLKQAQEVLGLMHDYQILLEHVRAVMDVTPKGSPGAGGLRAMAAAYDRDCRKLHAAYLKFAPRLAASAARVRDLELKVRNTIR